MFPHIDTVPIEAGTVEPRARTLCLTRTVRPTHNDIIMKLDHYRQTAGITASEFGRRIGVAHSTVLRWESGAVFPSKEMMNRIVRATGGQVSPNDLLFPQKTGAHSPEVAT